MIKKAFLERLSRKPTPNGDPISYELARTVGILTLYEDSTNLKFLTSQLELEGKSVRVISFIAKPVKNIEYPTQSFMAKGISITGALLTSEVSYFSEQKYDFLISLDSTANGFIKYILAKTQAKHKVGLFHSDLEGLLDLMIKPTNNQHLAEDVLKYLKMIRHD